MLNKKIVIFFFAAVLFSSPVYYTAASNNPNPPDIIELRTPEYKEHTKGLVVFTHEKHASDYNIKCGSCHHDDKGSPIESLKKGDSVDRCVFCHKETGKKPKEEKLTKNEWVKKYHKKALHTNCKDCHKKSNRKKGLNKNDVGAAPQDCKGCHMPKK